MYAPVEKGFELKMKIILTSDFNNSRYHKKMDAVNTEYWYENMVVGVEGLGKVSISVHLNIWIMSE